MIRNRNNRTNVSTQDSQERARRWLVNIDKRRGMRRSSGDIALMVALLWAFCIGVGVVAVVLALR